MNKKQCTTWLAAALLAGGGSLAAAEYGAHGALREPVYVGAATCARCHDSPTSGHQYSIWWRSAHARAYAALARPEARQIARLSGIPEDPWTAKMCLGCHATASDTEEWERMEGFHMEDGLQCEACHGPGSEYASAEIMTDRKAAMERGLKMPDERTCMVCHRTKGSHVAVLNSPKFDYKKAWARIAHPRPTPERKDDPAAAAAARSASRKYLGVMACAQCHEGEAAGFCFSRWRSGPHARAYADLTSPQGYERARAAGISGDPAESVQCLRCHTTGAGRAEEAFAEGFDHRRGVQCEACHGPGSDYATEAVMMDEVASLEAGLIKPAESVCLKCHAGAHGKTFSYEKALKKLMRKPKAPVNEDITQLKYKTPLRLGLTPDGRELWVTCEAGDSVIIVDPRTRKKIAEIPVGGQPTGICFDPEGKRAFVSNRLDDSVSVIDTATRKVTATLTVGDEPHGVRTDRAGRFLYVLNTSIDSISVFDLATLKEVKRLTTGRAPWSLALSPDGKEFLVTDTLPQFGPPRTPAESEIALVDAATGTVKRRILVHDANLLQGVAWHPSGEYALFTLLRTKNLVPMTRLLQGWTITNGLGILWRDGTVDQVLLDEPNICFPDPTDVTITPDGRYALVTSSGSDRVAVVDLEKMVHLLKSATPEERRRVIPNHLGKPVEFIRTFIATGKSPRGIVCTPDGKQAFVANALDDTLTAIDLAQMKPVETIDLGGPRKITKIRYGEQVFHSARISFHREFSCHTCHPDGHIDGMTYDIEPDGIGRNPVDNRTLRGINDMAPYKWEGLNPTLSRQCGPRLAVFFSRIDPFPPDQLSALDTYITTIPRPPNRYRKLNEKLTPSQRRGKKLFQRTMTNDGRVIPRENRCITCHPPPLYTDGNRHNVGTQGPLDDQGRFDAPHLNNIYDSAPYLHDGRAPTLEEIWTRFNPYDEHGVVNDMTKDQLNDLVEYLKTL